MDGFIAMFIELCYPVALNVFSMNTKYFPVVITQDKDGVYMATVPTMSGCHTQAKSLPELYERIEEAIGLWLEVKGAQQAGVPHETFIGVQQIPVSYSHA